LRAIDAWYLATQVEQRFWQATAATAGSGLTRYALTGNPSTLRLAGRMASFGARAHFAAVRGVLGTTLVRGGTATLGSALATGAAAVGVGYTAGAVIGTGISQALFGDEGARVALDLYMDPVKFVDKAILGVGDNISTIWNHYI
jgi:hypothetical protein